MVKKQKISKKKTIKKKKVEKEINLEDEEKKIDRKIKEIDEALNEDVPIILPQSTNIRAPVLERIANSETEFIPNRIFAPDEERKDEKVVNYSASNSQSYTPEKKTKDRTDINKYDPSSNSHVDYSPVEIKRSQRLDRDRIAKPVTFTDSGRENRSEAEWANFKPEEGNLENYVNKDLNKEDYYP